MSSGKSGHTRLPWILAGILGAICIGLAVVLFVVIIPKRGDHPDAFSANEKAAVAAARQFVVNEQTYSRASFDNDYDRALAGATGKLKQDLQSRKAALQKAMTENKIDLSGAVQEVAVEQSDKKSVVVLVSTTGYQVKGTTQTPVSISRLAITMTKVGKQWLASDLQSVGLV